MKETKLSDRAPDSGLDLRETAGKLGKTVGILVAAVLVVLIFALVCIERIPAGYVGVVYNMNGGVSGEVLGQGWHIVAPTKKVKEFTIGNEQIILSKDNREGSQNDDSFAVATSDNANIDIGFQMSYRFDEEVIVQTFKNFKGMDGEDIVNRRVRTVLKAKVSEVTTNYSMMDLYSGNRNQINSELTANLDKELHRQFGIQVIDASIIDVHPDAQLQQTISDRVTALQKQQQAKAEQETIKVQNETRIMNAEAEAREKQIRAESEAEIIRIKAEAEAEANKKIAESLTPELIEMQKYEKWDGKLPAVSGSSTPIINMAK